ncbi:MAG: hypothetical protein ACYDC9_12910 [Dermatophilaceae bacterium]
MWNDRAAVEREFGEGSVKASAARLGALVEANGPDPEDRSRLLHAIQAVMQAHADGLERLPEQGDPAFIDLPTQYIGLPTQYSGSLVVGPSSTDGDDLKDIFESNKI